MCRCNNQYWSCDHPKQMLPQFLSTLVNLETTTLLHMHGYKLIMFFDIHDSVNYINIDVMISILHSPINNVYICLKSI